MIARIRKNRDGHRRAVNTSALFRHGDPLDAVAAGLVLPVLEPCAVEDQRPGPCSGTIIAPVQSPLAGGEAGIGLEKLRGEELGVLATFGGTQFDADAHGMSSFFCAGDGSPQGNRTPLSRLRTWRPDR